MRRLLQGVLRHRTAVEDMARLVGEAGAGGREGLGRGRTGREGNKQRERLECVRSSANISE